MKQTIRVLSIAIFLLAIFFTAFLVSVIYSATKFRMNFHSPIFSLENEILKISLPVEVDNSGFHEVSDLNITTLLFVGNVTASEANTLTPLIKYGQNLVVFHNISIDLESLTSGKPHLLFEDTDLTLKYFVSLNFGNILPFNLAGQESLFWGAPFYNFSIGAFNLSVDDGRILVPVSFENHSNFFNVTGVLRLELFNEYGRFVGEGATSLDVSMGSRHDSVVVVSADLAQFTGKGALHIYFETSVFDYGVWKIDYGG